MHFYTLIARNVMRRRMRTTLTVVAMAVAIATVVALVGIADGFKATFMKAYVNSGIDLVVVRAGVQERINSTMDASLGDKIRGVPGVKDVSPSLLDIVTLDYHLPIKQGASKENPSGKDAEPAEPEVLHAYGVPLNGLEAGSRLLGELRVLEGRTLEPGDEHNVMVGRILAQNLQKKIGDTIELYGAEEFKIVGIYEGHSIFEDGSVMLLLNVLQRLMDREGQCTGFAVSVDNKNDVELIKRAASDIENLGPGLSAMSVKDHVNRITQIKAAQGMAWVTASIGLLIGGIGVLNTMFMSVLERTREIGILRAIGWRKVRVVRMILAESLLMSICGATVGTLSAIALTKLLCTLPIVNGKLEGNISPLVVAEGFGLAILVGLIGAAYPAWRSTQLLPREALHHD